MTKDLYLKLNSPFREAYRWYNWGYQDKGFGVREEMTKGTGNVRIEYEKGIYLKPKVEIRREAKKYNAYYQAQDARLLVTPIRSWQYLGSKADLEEAEREANLKRAAGF